MAGTEEQPARSMSRKNMKTRTARDGIRQYFPQSPMFSNLFSLFMGVRSYVGQEQAGIQILDLVSWDGSYQCFSSRMCSSLASDREDSFLFLHLFGDPIDSTWSLLNKVDTWRQCYALARGLAGDTAEADIKCLAIIFATRIEIENASYHERSQTNIENMALIRTAANELMRQRTNEIMRTGFAVAMYMFQVVSNFVPAVGASSDPSGGMIGPAMLLSWIVPVILLSIAIRDSGSPASTLEIMVKFTAHNEESINIDAAVTSKFSLRLFGIPWNGWKSKVS